LNWISDVTAGTHVDVVRVTFRAVRDDARHERAPVGGLARDAGNTHGTTVGELAGDPHQPLRTEPGRVA
jgi:hypothetical protein